MVSPGVMKETPVWLCLAFLRDEKIRAEPAMEEALRVGDQLSLQAAFTMSEGLAIFFSSASATVKQAQVLPT